jgi:ElaB/YqjD/DUF883 family membrane-anchored ribosome-binding protein
MEEATMDTIEVEAQAGSPDGSEGQPGATRRARAVVSDVADAARSAVETHAPTVRDAAGSAAAAVQTHAPTVIEAGRSTASAAYEQVRTAPDEQLAMGTAFAAGLVAGFILARVPRPLLFLALVPLAVLGGTLLGRKGPMRARARRRSRASTT